MKQATTGEDMEKRAQCLFFVQNVLVFTKALHDDVEITGAMCGLTNEEYSTKTRRVSCPSTATVTDFTSTSSSTVTHKSFH